MQIRLTDDPALLEEAGNPAFVTVFGLDVGFDPVDASELTDVAKGTLRGNPYFVCDGGPLDHDGDGEKGGSAPSSEKAELIAQLEGLGVKFDKRWSVTKLEAALDAATAPDSEDEA